MTDGNDYGSISNLKSRTLHAKVKDELGGGQVLEDFLDADSVDGRVLAAESVLDGGVAEVVGQSVVEEGDGGGAESVLADGLGDAGDVVREGLHHHDRVTQLGGQQPKRSLPRTHVHHT